MLQDYGICQKIFSVWSKTSSPVHGTQRSQLHRFARLKPRRQRKTICHRTILMAADRQRDPYGVDGWRHRPPTASAVGYINTAAMRLPPRYTLSRRLPPSNHSHSIVTVNRLPSRCCRGRLSPPVCEAHRGSGTECQGG